MWPLAGGTQMFSPAKLGSVILLAGSVAVATLPASAFGAPGGGVAGSAHDFTNRADIRVGACTFCHTPHKAQTTTLLWNHTFSDNTYSWIDTTRTQAGTALPTFTKTWNGPTPKCLSCHDGSVAVGDLAWFDGQSRQGGNNIWSETHDQGDKVNVGFGGNMSGNHPVVVPYPGVGTRQYGATQTGGAYVPAEWNADPAANGIVLFRASDNTLGATVTRVTNAPSAADNLGIECASCHDPHNKLSVDKFFLRGKLKGNDSNYICLKCHVK